MSIRILQYIQYNISSVYYLDNVLLQIENCSIKYNNWINIKNFRSNINF